MLEYPVSLDAVLLSDNPPPPPPPLVVAPPPVVSRLAASPAAEGRCCLVAMATTTPAVSTSALLRRSRAAAADQADHADNDGQAAGGRLTSSAGAAVSLHWPPQAGARDHPARELLSRSERRSRPSRAGTAAPTDDVTELENLDAVGAPPASAVEGRCSATDGDDVL